MGEAQAHDGVHDRIGLKRRDQVPAVFEPQPEVIEQREREQEDQEPDQDHGRRLARSRRVRPAFGGGTRWRGRLPIPAHCHPLVRRLIAEANAQKTTMQEIADRAGLRRGTVSQWRYTRTPNITTFEAALNVLDLELCVRRRRA